MALIEGLIYFKNHLAWYLLESLVSKEDSLKLDATINQLIKDVSIYAEDITSGFNIPKFSLIAPIYTGYEKYYSVDKTGGEHYDKLRPKF